VMTSHMLIATAIAGAAVALATIALRSRIAKLHERAVVAQQNLIDAFTTTLHARLELVAAHAEDPAVKRVAVVATEYEREAKRSAAGVALLGRAPVAVALIVCGLVLAIDDASITLHWTANTKALLVLAAALPVLLNVIFGLQQMVRHIERLRPFTEVVMRPARADALASTSASTSSSSEIGSFSRVRFEDVSFAYHAEAGDVLDKLNIDWKNGVLILRGPNGSGKSTVLSLMLGLRAPRLGRVLVDDKALVLHAARHMRAHVAFLPQRPYLGEPHANVGDALRLLVPSATTSEMLDALRQVGLDEALARDGHTPFEVLIGELSVGQRQRLALARVVLRKADIILLDEPDANLDADAIEKLRAIVMDLAKDHMVAVAAHGPLLELLQGQVCVLE
jgi:ABC-type multidrug transport system fused ATPase/permease subunit